ncbi:GIY-YIG nuclease family protein [Candidatus Dojkabacteria bacterium]|jgi:putative endonuclease|uniref:GIY-YIG nuclease family protein n=1 Tax=Candidatus Dojkabacteria bacterium TaxID=2099670 RepID=A0A955IE39_9BACT|nr:GIY-YIG nuclease family protein [Candidatus Dojkabacteria bacterium]
MCNLYILLCKDKSLYTGIAKNLEERMEIHKIGKGSKYVNSRKPFKLIYTESFESWSEALKREMEIKKWSRAQKIARLGLNFEKIKG